MGSAIAPLLFPYPPRQNSARAIQSHRGLVWLDTATVGKTPAILEKRPESKYTLLYVHGNAEDLGELSPMLPDMANQCGASVFAVEYPGYSISEAADPAEHKCYEAVEAAYQYLTTSLGILPEHVVPFGRSLGSGSAVHLAYNHSEIRGLVLQSPLESGARAVLNKTVSFIGYFADPFKNYTKIGYVEAKTCIMHGTVDEVVPCHNGQSLYKQLEKRGKAATPLWITGRGHNDMPADKVMRHVRTFLVELEREEKEKGRC